jgi:hypothetical protein
LEQSITVEISAPLERVWEVLGDVESWPLPNDVETRPYRRHEVVR